MSRRSRPGLGPTAVLGLAGSGLAAVSSAQVWGRAEAAMPAARTVEARGADVAPLALPLALVALASWGAILVLRRRGRRVVAGLGLAAAVGVLVTVLVRVGEVSQTAGSMLAGGSARADLETTTTAWPYVACVGAVLAAAAFVVALRSASGWPEMSRRYDAPAAGNAPAAGATDGDAAPADLWRALDEGRDPTD